MEERAKRRSTLIRLDKVRRRKTKIEDESLEFYSRNKKIRSQLKSVEDQYAFDKYSIDVEGGRKKSVTAVSRKKLVTNNC